MPHLFLTVIYLLARALLGLVVAAIGLVVVSVVQRRLLPVATSFDTEFGRLWVVLAVAGVSALGAVALSLRWGMQQFAPGERILQSCLALLLVALCGLIWLRS